MTRRFGGAWGAKLGREWVILLPASICLGCTAIAGLGQAATDEPVILGSSVEPAGSETNDSFGAAEPLTIPTGGKILTSNDLGTLEDVDVYDLGPVTYGERLNVNVASDGILDPAVAVFNGQGHALMVNDDKNYFSGDWDSSLTLVMREDSERCYVAVARSAKSSSQGGYDLTVARDDAGLDPVVPALQIVYLNFDGAEAVVIGPRDAVDVPAFDAARISSSYAGQTEEMMQRLTDWVRADFRGMQVEIIGSHEEDPPSVDYSVVHFGAYDPALLGVAENVDEFNERQEQPAIVFVDTFAAFAVLEPSVEEMAQALANVASHEIGHLLGLNHTRDVHDLMDISASLQELMADQVFSIAALDPTIFPLGEQDSIALILEAVGGDAATARAAAQLPATARMKGPQDVWAVPARTSVPFSTGCHCYTAERALQ